MPVVTNFGASPGLSEDYREVTRPFEYAIKERLAGFSFSSGPEYVGLFVTLLVENAPKNAVKFSPRRRELSSSIYLDASEWLAANGDHQTAVFATALLSSIQQIPDKWVTPHEKCQLSDVISETLSATAPGARLAPIDTTPLQARVDQRWQITISIPEGATGSIEDIARIEDRLEALSRGLYAVDGHDFGVGGASIFLYTADPNQTEARLRQLAADGHLPSGCIITAR